ncbi:biotin carboxylase N-terminal domain-containing protein [Gordonia sp. CPCC 205333]|uniref:ATP-binding protein n=1 Tax=Gordonia sp. CPCC 205333 TaxID=3140790 RepID=UPI003AF344D8
MTTVLQTDGNEPTVITSVLVANRGEIACRVFRTCKDMGIATVAVYSDPDADAPHVRAADAAVPLPGSSSAQTYLRGDLVIAAALSAGADAIHPGYGFLSENAEFAQAVINAGLTWIGPPPAAITAMGSKINAKELMSAAGVPVLGDIDPDSVTPDDLPLLIKASAGGGGRGMRIVRDVSELADQVSGAKREAESAFGDPTIFCEPYVERGHHIEVQVMADQHGAIWAVGERECSIQRRHQKVVEEAPSPLVESLGGNLRERLFDAARKAVAAIGYTGAGTVEFLADGQGRFYFLETNTRLQVEHPVTEETTGLDLVEWQLRVAMGEHLDSETPVTTGHSIEVRLYAEDPSADWQPQSGTVHRFAIDTRPGIRVDSGITDGSEITTFYDPMLAKVIGTAPTRTRAARLLAAALADARLHGPVTNRDMLVNTLRSKEFLSGDTDTGFIDEVGLDVLGASVADAGDRRLAAIAATLSDSAEQRLRATVLGDLPSGWRNLASGYSTRRFLPGIAQASPTEDAGQLEVRYRHSRHRVELPDDATISITSTTSSEVTAEVDGVRRTLSVNRYGTSVFVDWPGKSVVLSDVPRFVDPSSVQRPGSLLAPMPGAVIRVAVAEGDRVAAGQPLLWLEAMKMEHTIAAPSDGVVATLSVAPGQQLAVGEVLAVIVGEDTEESASSEN